MMRYSYFPGCCHHTSAKEYALSSQALCRKLGIELVEVPDWSCCGSSAAHSTNHLLAVALAARNLAQAEKNELDVMAPCAACYQRLALADYHMKNSEETFEKVNSILDRPYRGGLKVRSMLDVAHEIKDTISAGIVNPLDGLKTVTYYGCLLVRPSYVKVDDTEDPQKMDDLLREAGAEVLDWGMKTECCGASLGISNEDIVLRLVSKILNAAREAGADCIVTCCPLCHFNLDSIQGKINKAYGDNFSIPVFYFTQLLGIALNISSDELSFDSHFVNPSKIIKSYV